MLIRFALHVKLNLPIMLIRFTAEVLSMGIRENVIRLRKLSGLTQEELADIADVSRAAVSLWEIGKSEPRMGAIQRLSDHFGVPKAAIVEDGGMDSAMRTHSGQIKILAAPAPYERFVDVPLYGSIAAGTPIEMIAVDDTHPIPECVRDAHPGCFLLRVVGESMNRVLPNGSYALVEPCEDVVHDGKPYAVCVNGFDATIKRVRKLANGFELIPDSTDPTYRPVVYDYGMEGTEEITVIGRVVWYCIPFDFEI